MDPTATPWRVLEDPANKPAKAVPPAVPPGIPRSALLIGGSAVLLALLAFLLALGTGGGGSVMVDGGAPLGSAGLVETDSAGLGSAVRSDAPELVVEIVGAVHRPGVYRLPPGSRLGDLVEAAGGYGARVDADRASRELNLAALLRDGDHLRVPSRDEAVSSGQRSTSPGSASGGPGSGPLDLNLATSSELEALPGIGPVTAAKIVSSRDEQPFASVGDLRTRKLLGEKTFEKLKDLVTVR